MAESQELHPADIADELERLSPEAAQERLRNLYPGQHKFSIHPNREKGVIVNIEIPNRPAEKHASIENTYSG